jgi:hypothetical protein
VVFYVLTTSLLDLSLPFSLIFGFAFPSQFELSLEFFDAAGFWAIVAAVSSGHAILCLILAQELSAQSSITIASSPLPLFLKFNFSFLFFPLPSFFL